MTLSTYADLTAAIADYNARSDLTSVIPTFITLTEVMAQFGDGGNDIEPLRVREMETTSTALTPDANGNITIPADFLEMRRVTYNSDPKQVLTYLSPSDLNAMYGDADGDDDDPDDVDNALHYTIVGSSLTIRPIGSSTVTLDYYQKIPALTASNTTNWLMTKAPTVYLYGCQFQASIYTQNPEAATAYLGLYRNAIMGLQKSELGSKAASFVIRAGMPAW